MLHGRARPRSWIASFGIAVALVGSLGSASASADTPAEDRRPPIVRPLTPAQVHLARLALRADRVIAAARSQLGVPYVYASARPGHGFDCSGLVMWAWSRVGVHLPHNSTEQFLTLPHVDRAHLRPGDILYFREPEDHVAIYLGGDLMIHAPHRGDHVRVQHVYWRHFVGAARPAL
jgi:cell wall-associated NlpC family hydrolase